MVVPDSGSCADAIIYTPQCKRVISRQSNDKNIGPDRNQRGGVDILDATFFYQRSIAKSSNVVGSFQTRGLICLLLMHSPDLDNSGAQDRNQSSAINYGYSFLNFTDRSRVGAKKLPCPMITQRYNKIPGWMSSGLWVHG